MLHEFMYILGAVSILYIIVLWVFIIIIMKS